ncbi:alpha/beta-hydrolase [Coccomyxa subellipsoidea C-169]|uniref:protein-S-isoprenylcysteine alpha-carbonyl methylesterase n=1 Tax=Coccomyxa subellipsoidea (strain C-169) TaxID=574566 RepID=I0YS47_COCSC|nr:alpha/beta-hydrolase [Coccomyxa subellipsoidea C-169]EIE21216.1 alpha/beta-hydrolase [Coccomyxa subellipsoidea C-169]|eukprot:XP_005645760.1 alpha/beta-hydrolase [Coccomyxa subellipsoidea C-169]
MPRNIMDIYVPPSEPAGSDNSEPLGNDDEVLSSSSGRPVAVFCHGGVWASGAKWHYAPMATRLAQQGILTCVVEYSLFPEVRAPKMVAELSSALSWTLDNISQYGGSPAKVTALGHSAGAQLWAMVLLHRAMTASEQRLRKESRTEIDQGAATVDCRMPAQFIGMAGVYDIGKHYQYEAARGVHFLSTMARAIGGAARFASQSPAAILARAAARSSGPKESEPAAQ